MAPIPKSSAGPKARTGASMGKMPGKTSFGSSISKSNTSTFGLSNKTSKVPPSKVSSKTPFFGSSASSSGLSAPPKKTYDAASFATKKGKYRFDVIWIPTKNRKKKKDMAYSSINYEKQSDRAPSMFNFMSGDSSELHKKKEEEASLVLPGKVISPIAGAVAIAEVIPEKEEKLKKRDISDSKEAAGDGNSEDESYMENEDSLASSPDEKKVLSADKVDSVFVNSGSKVPPRSTASTPDEEDCVIKCLYYTLQCCDCVLM